MSVNSRFIKFKCENKNDNLKFNNNNIVNVLFYSKTNLLLSKDFSKDKSLATFLKKMIENNSANIFMVRSEKGMFLLIKRKDHDTDLNQKYLEDLIAQEIVTDSIKENDIIKVDVDNKNSKLSLNIGR